MKVFALAGNPNCGKTTLFNALTGSTAHVGNWPGVTVDKREGVYRGGKEKATILDLPGIYSLSPYTPEEVIARNYLLDTRPDAIINIVDATNLERNLYLTTQLLEMDVPVIIALNFIDEVEKLGDKLDVALLEERLGVPVVSVSALQKKGIDKLMERALAMDGERKGKTFLMGALGDKIERAVAYFKTLDVPSPVFHALKMLECDEIELKHSGAREKQKEIADGQDLEAVVADERYKYITANFSPARIRSARAEVATKSYKADKVLTHKVWGIPIFLVILFAVFHLTFSEDLLYINAIFGGANGLPTFESMGFARIDGTDLYQNFGVGLLACFYDGAVFSPGVIFANLLNLVLGYASYGISLGIGALDLAPWVSGLVCDGIVSGIFSVLGFLPQILTLFLFFSILEDSGYMARIAFILDKLFRKFGLSGRAFMPMIMGFGCSVPAMINTRTLADKNERTATVRVIPFFSCGAKMPILTAIAGGICAVSGTGNADLITYSMYVLGVMVAIISVLIMRNTTMRGEIPPFIMELPTYRMPGFLSLMLHLWDKAKHFVQKAFTVIFASTVIVWFLQSFGFDWRPADMQNSILASLGKFIQPLFTPLGFGSQLSTEGWVFAVAAITGLIAKENVIATFSVLAAMFVANFEGTEEGVAEVVVMMQNTGITVPALLAFITFNMTTIPCVAACGAAKAELPKGKFIFTLIFWVVASYLASTVVYTVGAWWWTSFVWLAIGVVVWLGIYLYNLKKNKEQKI